MVGYDYAAAERARASRAARRESDGARWPFTFRTEIEFEAVREHGCLHRSDGSVCAECFELLWQMLVRDCAP